MSVHQLFEIKRRFLELDLDGSGTINRDELVATGGDAMGEHSAEIQHALEAMDELMEEVANNSIPIVLPPPFGSQTCARSTPLARWTRCCDSQDNFRACLLSSLSLSLLHAFVSVFTLPCIRELSI